MKRFITLIIAAFAAVLSLSAREANASVPAQIETKDYNFAHFTELEIGFTYQVELTRSDRYAVSVEAPDFMAPYLRVELRGSRLVLSCYELPRDVRRRLDSGRYKLRAFVSMPELDVLKMSGASKLEATGEFTPRRTFVVALSGASSVSGLAARSRDASFECSGASRMAFSGSFDRVDIEISGSGNCDFDFSAKEAEVELSGASKLFAKGNITRLDVETSGASTFTMSGKVGALDCGASGASKISMEYAAANVGKVRLSGASNAIVDVRDELGFILSGASSLRYCSHDRLRIVEQNVSRASSVSSYTHASGR